MSRNTWNDDKKLPEKVAIKIVVHDFYLRNRTKAMWATALFIIAKLMPWDFLGMTLERMGTLIRLLFNN